MPLNRRDLVIGISAVVASVPLGGSVALLSVVKSTQVGGRQDAESGVTLSGMAAQEHDPFDVTLGQRLKKLREGRNLTQRELGDLLGVSQGSVSAYESGKHKVAPRHLHLLCRLYNVSSDDLLGLQTLRQGRQQNS